MSMKFIVLLGISMFFAASVTGCNGEETTAGRDAPAAKSVVASTPIMADVVKVLLDGTGIEVTESTDNAASGVMIGEQAVAVDVLVPADRRIAQNQRIYGDIAMFAEFGVAGLAFELSRAFPSHADRIASNALNYQGELLKLDDYARRTMARVPENQRTLRSNLKENAYLARAYGLTYEPAAGETTELDGELLFESPAPKGTFEATYLGMMDHAITHIAAELGAPGIDIHGFSGKLTFGHDHDH